MAKEHPLSAVAHEFLSPLAALRGYIELAVKEAPERLSAAQREHLEVALSSADRLQHFIEDWLEIARLEAKAVALEPAAVPPGDLLDCALHALRRPLAEGFEVRVSCPDLAPITVDVRLVTRVLDRLLRHALQFVPKGSALDVEVAGKDRAVEWRFLERGVRLEDGDLEGFFDCFSQPYFAGAGRRARQSTVAMAAARLIVERHGGSIRAEQTSEGLAVRFTLPR